MEIAPLLPPPLLPPSLLCLTSAQTRLSIQYCVVWINNVFFFSLFAFRSKSIFQYLRTAAFMLEFNNVKQRRRHRYSLWLLQHNEEWHFNRSTQNYSCTCNTFYDRFEYMCHSKMTHSSANIHPSTSPSIDSQQQKLLKMIHCAEVQRSESALSWNTATMEAHDTEPNREWSQDASSSWIFGGKSSEKLHRFEKNDSILLLTCWRRQNSKNFNPVNYGWFLKTFDSSGNSSENYHNNDMQMMSARQML